MFTQRNIIMFKGRHLPVCLNLKAYRILMVGGGNVATQKLKTLLQFDCRVTVVTREANEKVKKMAKKGKIKLCLERFKNSHLKGYDLIYACTDDSMINERVARLAKRKSALYNIAGHPNLSNFISPAVYREGKITVAVSTSGTNPPLAVSLRDAIGKSLNKKRY